MTTPASPAASQQAAERSEFGPPEAGEGGQQDQRPIAWPDRISQA